MPNHVRNILTIRVDPENVGKIFSEEEYGAMAHRPTTAEEEVEAVLDFIAQDGKRGTIDFEKIIPMPEDIYRGDVGPNEMLKYGDKNWYEWSIIHWGTKWNAYDFKSDERNPNPVIFSTAWDAPYEIYKALAKKFKNIIFNVLYADEDIGCNCGVIDYYRGCYFITRPYSLKEGIEFACRVWYGASPDHCGFRFNKDEDIWEYVDED